MALTLAQAYAVLANENAAYPIKNLAKKVIEGAGLQPLQLSAPQLKKLAKKGEIPFEVLPNQQVLPQYQGYDSIVDVNKKAVILQEKKGTEPVIHQPAVTPAEPPATLAATSPTLAEEQANLLPAAAASATPGAPLDIEEFTAAASDNVTPGALSFADFDTSLDELGGDLGLDNPLEGKGLLIIGAAAVLLFILWRR